MDLQTLYAWAQHFYLQYPIFCYVLGGILLLLTFWKPLKVLKAALLLLALAVILYICFALIDSMNFGREIKEKAIHRTEKSLE